MEDKENIPLSAKACSDAQGHAMRKIKDPDASVSIHHSCPSRRELLQHYLESKQQKKGKASKVEALSVGKVRKSNGRDSRHYDMTRSNPRRIKQLNYSQKIEIPGTQTVTEQANDALARETKSFSVNDTKAQANNELSVCPSSAKENSTVIADKATAVRFGGKTDLIPSVQLNLSQLTKGGTSSKDHRLDSPAQGPRTVMCKSDVALSSTLHNDLHFVLLKKIQEALLMSQFSLAAAREVLNNLAQGDKAQSVYSKAIFWIAKAKLEEDHGNHDKVVSIYEEASDYVKEDEEYSVLTTGLQEYVNRTKTMSVKASGARHLENSKCENNTATPKRLQFSPIEKNEKENESGGHALEEKLTPGRESRERSPTANRSFLIDQDDDNLSKYLAPEEQVELYEQPQLDTDDQQDQMKQTVLADVKTETQADNSVKKTISQDHVKWLGRGIQAVSNFSNKETTRRKTIDVTSSDIEVKGSVVTIAEVKNRPIQALEFGSPVSAMPVRRSARFLTTPGQHNMHATLEKAAHTYTPNKWLYGSLAAEKDSNLIAKSAQTPSKPVHTPRTISRPFGHPATNKRARRCDDKQTPRNEILNHLAEEADNLSPRFLRAPESKTRTPFRRSSRLSTTPLNDTGAVPHTNNF